MAQDHILRLPRSDISNEYLLVNISGSGNKPLNLKLVASEGEHVYPTTLKESNIKSLQEHHFEGGLDEWRSFLAYALLRQRPSGSLPASWQGFEIVAAIKGETAIITIRNNFGGIHKKLGTIKLEQNDAEEINPFDWANTAVATADELRDQLETLQAYVATNTEQVAKLNRELNNLVKVKREHEEELVKKFAALLNSKKLKIRDQQRLLAGAKVDPVAAKTVSAARDGGDSKDRKAGASRQGKRKASDVRPPKTDGPPGQDEEAATEDEDDEPARQETPQPSDQDETEDEEDEEGFEAPPSTTRAKRADGTARDGETLAAAKGKENSKATHGDPKEQEMDESSPEQAPTASNEEDETDDDDEL